MKKLTSETVFLSGPILKILIQIILCWILISGRGHPQHPRLVLPELCDRQNPPFEACIWQMIWIWYFYKTSHANCQLLL